MAQFALPLSLIFILIALWEDARESRHISHSLWIPFIWLSICASRPFTLWIYPRLVSTEASDYDYVQGSATERTFLISLLIASLIILYRRKGSFSFGFRDNSYLMLFYAYAVMSVAWSDYQGPSIKRWIRAAGDVIMVVVILSEDDPKEAFERVLRRCAIVLIPLSFLFIRFYGYIGINYTPDGRRMWTGVTTNKNSLGMLCAFMGMMLVWRMSKSRGLSLSVCVDLMLLALALYLLRGSQSATSQVVFVSGVTILLMARIAKGNSKRLKRMVIVTLVVLLLAQGIMVTLFSSSLSDLLYSATQRDSSFTGRTLLWQELFKIGMKNFILGSGYGSFWLGRHIEDQVGFRVITAHNGYLEVFLELGIIGLILLLFLIIHSLQQAMTFLDEDYSLAILRLGFLSMVIFHNFTESTMGGGTNLLWFLFLLSSVILAKRPSPRISADQNP